MVPSDAIRAEAFRNDLRESPMYYLKAYSGIGEATMQRLRDAGYDTIFDVQELLSRTPFPVPGIGASRAADIRSAIRADLQKRRQWFDAGDNSHARRAEAEIMRLTVERDARIARNEVLASRLQQDIARIQPALKAAVIRACNS